jgi:hypothetical protein
MNAVDPRTAARRILTGVAPRSDEGNAQLLIGSSTAAQVRHGLLYWRDRNLKFHLYEPTAPTESIDELLDEIDTDRTAIFWG